MTSGAKQQEAVAACNALTRRWVAGCDGGETVLSGPSLWPLLAALLGAADGPARDELARAVGLAPEDALASATALPIADGTTAARSVWVRDEVELSPAWVDAVAPLHVARLRGDDRDRSAIDRWVVEATGGQIEAAPLDVDGSTLLALLGVITVRVRWEEPFDEGLLRPEDGPWQGRWVPSLHLRTGSLDRVRVADVDGGAVTLLATSSTAGVDVHLALGEEGLAPGAVLAAAVDAVTGGIGVRAGATTVDLAGPGLRRDSYATHQEGAPDELVLSLAAFSVAGDHDLLERPDVCGLGAAVDDGRGHFPGLAPQPLAVSQARQVARAEFSAEGFEAAAVTAIGMRAGSAMPRHDQAVLVASFHRPFGFVAVDRASGLVLVAGWVAEPRDDPHGA